MVEGCEDMNVNRHKVKFGEIVAYMYIPDTKKALNAIVFAHGWPGPPQQGKGTIAHKFARRGYLTICPHYIGTFDSEGVCTFDNIPTTILETINFLKKGKVKLPWEEEAITWKVKNISLIGGSFGASVVLVAGAKSKDVKNIIAVATPTDYRDQGKRFENEESIELDYQIIKYCWKTLDTEDKYWKKLLSGDVDLNAVDYIPQLRTKNVFLIHGKIDTDVNPQRSIDLYDKIKNGTGKSKLVLLPKTKHIGCDVFKRKDIFKEAIKWLRGRAK